jgi:hypothetical protein
MYADPRYFAARAARRMMFYLLTIGVACIHCNASRFSTMVDQDFVDWIHCDTGVTDARAGKRRTQPKSAKRNLRVFDSGRLKI